MTRVSLLLASAAFLAGTLPVSAMEGVVASIKPIHSLAAAIMDGVDEPALLIEGAGSPHNYAMRPSDAAKLQDARLVFWVGPGLETFLDEPLSTLGAEARVVTLGETEGLVRLAYREGGAFESHDHAHEDGHDHAEGHQHGEAHDHAEHHDAAAHAEEGHDHDAGFDSHYWLDPENAKVMAGAMAAALADTDQDNAEAYLANAEALTARLDELTAEIEAQLAPVADRPFIVFHDAYHYFEDRFGLEAAGALTINPEIAPGAGRVAEIKERVADLGATCVFAEPQFEPRIIEVVTEGTDAGSGVLDPLGADLADGPDLYFQLIRNMAASFTDCLGD